MLAKTGLLIVTNPNRIAKILATVQKQVKNTLYIQLTSALSDPCGTFQSSVLTVPKCSQIMHSIYSQAASECRNLDIRVLISSLKTSSSNKIKTKYPIDLIIFDKTHNQLDIDSFIKTRIENVTNEYKILNLDSGEFESLTSVNEKLNQNKIYKHCVLGGTFDRLHIAHKLLLSEAILHSNEKVTVGVTQENMLQSKTLWELIEDIDLRVKNVTEFVTDVFGDLNYDVVPILDPFGPAIVDHTMEMIVVSEETVGGGNKINQIRQEKGLPLLDILPIELVDEPFPNPAEEKKISSSTGRLRLLGTVLKKIEVNHTVPKSPYVIGLTGGIASGKSNVAKELEELGAFVINCDLLAHELYKKEKPCFKLLVDHFGNSIVGDDGEIDRKQLGSIVFKNHKELENLNSIVWPAMAEEIKNIIKNCDKNIVVVEAAVLLLAGWQTFCHEVWTTLVSKEEAIKRMIDRNNLNEDQAKSRLEAQPNNKYYVQNAHVVFCTYWPKDYTRQQVLKAWSSLKERVDL